MYYIVKKNAFGEYIFWNARVKNFRYNGGSAYASLDGAKKAFSAIVETYNIDASGVEIVSTETILNSYNQVMSLA